MKPNQDILDAINSTIQRIKNCENEIVSSEKSIESCDENMNKLLNMYKFLELDKKTFHEYYNPILTSKNKLESHIEDFNKLIKEYNIILIQLREL